MGYFYFVLIYKWLNEKIVDFGLRLMQNLMTWASGIALILVTLWILIQGYRIITGQSRDSMMAMVVNMARIAVIVTVATTMGVFGSELHHFFTVDLTNDVNQLFTNSDKKLTETIDDNLAFTQIALAAIDAVQLPASANTPLADEKAHALLMAGFGTASPPMAAAAMLLLYQFTLALFIGLGPLFVLCLIFDQTKDLFRRWLLYGIGTIFSMAMLAVVSSIVLELTARVAGALWLSNAINNLTHQGAEGISSMALQQGGLGLLMTVLIVSVPPIAASFFQGTAGNFLTYSAFGAGGAAGLGPQGQPQGSYQFGSGRSAPVFSGTQGTSPQNQAYGGSLSSRSAVGNNIATNSGQADSIKAGKV